MRESGVVVEKSGSDGSSYSLTHILRDSFVLWSRNIATSYAVVRSSKAPENERRVESRTFLTGREASAIVETQQI